MPVISRFFGIIIVMYYREHSPPHFHAKVAGKEATVSIPDGVVRGALPAQSVTLVRAWCSLHRQELLDNWERAQKGEALVPIAPLR